MNTIRKILAGALVALTFTFATVGVGAPQASAATSTTACFKWSDGTPYMNRTVQLWQMNSAGNRVAKLRDGRTDANGCGTFFNTPSNMYLAMRAVHIDYLWWGNAVYEGWTSRMSLPGQGGALLGIGWVYRIA
jgi:hypothetical protein